MLKAIGAAVGAIIVGVVTWWLTEGLRTKEPSPPIYQPPPITSPMKKPATMSQVEPNIDRNGSDYKDFVAGSINECLNACAQESQCKAITFNKASRQCWMKTSVPSRSDNSNYMSAVKVGE